MLTKGTKLRFWCQKVLPLVYDDSLSYYELLNKVVLHLNQNTEDINALIDFYNTFAEDVEDIIREMMEDGEFNVIIADTLGNLIAQKYTPTQNYIPLNYAIHEAKFYCCTESTTGEWDETKWRETKVGDELNTLMQRVFALNAGQVSFDESATYSSGTVGNKLKNLTANNVSYNSSETYGNGTVGKELNDLNEQREVNILVVGNSFNQDMMAYLPPIMEEALPDIKFNWCLLYEGSSDFDTHIQMFLDDTKYNYTNIWEDGDTAWHRYHRSEPEGMTLKTALQYKPWDMIFMQATTSDVQSEELIQTKIITAGRRLMRAIAASAISPFSFYTIEWLGRGDNDTEINNNYAAIHHGMIETMQTLGFKDYVPVGTAFQNARTNSTIKALGTGVSMLYTDNVHAQAGAPALLGNYVMAAFLCGLCGNPKGIIEVEFHPTTDVAIAINARTADNPVGMTHGASSTITMPVQRALQEIAYITLNNPTHVTDCSNIVVTVPEP